jgi:uncharacterized protein YneF (UPF0154 family)
MNLIPLFAIWALLAITVIGMLIWRKVVARNEDDSLHVLDAVSAQRSTQAVVAHKLEVIDKWGKILTVIAVVYGLILGGLYVYQVFVQNTSIGV